MIHMLSTVRRIVWEDMKGNVLAEIVRVKGREVLKGQIPRGRACYQVIEYFGKRGDDRSLVTP